MNEVIAVKPYMLRALYEWCVDNGFSPHLLTQVDRHTRVPKEHVIDNQITLNLTPQAVHQLVIGNELIRFSARFSGVSQEIVVPVSQVISIFARENGQGLAFEVVDEPDDLLQTEEQQDGVVKPKPKLQLVK